MFYYYDPTYLLLIPGLLLALYAQFKVSSTYNHWKQVPSRIHMTGAEIARAILDSNGCGDVAIEHVSGSLTDHYDPEGGVLRLKTDNAGLFDFSLGEFEAAGMDVVKCSRDLHASPFAEGNVMTEYETNFTAKGMPIYFAEVRVK